MGHPGDLQNASVPILAVASLLSLFVALRLMV
jgi:hypothetical protein